MRVNISDTLLLKPEYHLDVISRQTKLIFNLGSQNPNLTFIHLRLEKLSKSVFWLPDPGNAWLPRTVDSVVFTTLGADTERKHRTDEKKLRPTTLRPKCYLFR